MYLSNENGPATQQVDICRRLREAIILGRLEHGQRITEKFISEMMNVKRGPARESLLILEGQGVIRKVPSLGYFVESHTEDEVRDVYNVRIGLETLAVRRAAKHATLEDFVRLKVICKEMRTALENDDVEMRLRADFDFHTALIQASGSRILKNAYAALPRPFYGPTKLTAKKAERVAKQHEALLEAIIAHDADLAVELLTEHISEHDQSIELLKECEETSSDVEELEKVR